MALSKLSGDEQQILFRQLWNVLDPGIAVALSSVSNELCTATQALKQQLKADHKAAAALCRKLGMRNCKELREAKNVRCDPRGLTADDVDLLGTLGSVQPALKRLHDMWRKRIINFNWTARLGCLFARRIIIGDEYRGGHIYWIDPKQPDAPSVPFTHASLDGFMVDPGEAHHEAVLDGTDLASRLVQIYRGEVQGIRTHPDYQACLPGMCRRYCIGVVRGWLLDTARDGTPQPSARLLDGIGLVIEIDGKLVLDRRDLASNAFEAAAAVGCAAHGSCYCGDCEGEGEHEDEGEGEEGDDVDGGVDIDVDIDGNVDDDETDHEMDAGATAQQQALAAEQQALAALLQSMHLEETAEMTFEQKVQLGGGIIRLSSMNFARVVALIRKSMPAWLGEGQEVIDIDLNALDNRTLWKLHNFVNTCDAIAFV